MDDIKRQHKDTMFRGFFKVPRNFLHLLAWCRGGAAGLSVEDITPVDLDAEMGRRIVGWHLVIDMLLFTFSQKQQ